MTAAAEPTSDDLGARTERTDRRWYQARKGLWQPGR